MNWLIWKEYRLQRLVLAVGLFLLVVPYSFPLFAILFDESTGELWPAAPVFSLLCSVLTLGLLGGNAIASERVDRSAEFLAYQPASRRSIVFSKLAFPLAAAVVIWGINLFALGLVMRAAERFHFDILVGFSIFAISGSCACGVAWLVSSFQNSPTFAAASGIVAPIAVASFVSLAAWLAGMQTPRIVGTSFSICASLIALLSFVGGTWYFLRRVEP